jgi:hypothetical protein
MAANSPKSSGGQFRRRDTDSSLVWEKKGARHPAVAQALNNPARFSDA